MCRRQECVSAAGLLGGKDLTRGYLGHVSSHSVGGSPHLFPISWRLVRPPSLLPLEYGAQRPDHLHLRTSLPTFCDVVSHVCSSSFAFPPIFDPVDNIGTPISECADLCVEALSLFGVCSGAGLHKPDCIETILLVPITLSRVGDDPAIAGLQSPSPITLCVSI